MTMKDFEKHLKNLKLPHFENNIHFKLLEEKLKLKIQKIETQKKEKTLTGTNPIFKYSFVFLSLIIFTAIIFSIFIIFYNSKHLEYSLVSINGNVFFKKNDKKNFIKFDRSNKLIQNNTIKTDAGSNIIFTIGNDYNIKINEESELKLLKAEKRNKNESCVFFMTNGFAEYSVKLPSIASIFRIDTYFSTFNVKGTMFNIKVKKNEYARLTVKEGNVAVGNYFNRLKDLKKIKKLDHEIYEQLFSLINDELIIHENASIIINKKDVDLLNNNLYTEVYLKLINIKKINDYEKKSIIENINKIKNIKNNLLFSNNEKENNIDVNDSKEKNSEEKKIRLHIFKLPYKLKITLQEKNTAITGNKNYLFIADDSNNSVYCIDTKNKKVKWQFKDENFKSITAPVISFNNEMIFGSPDYLFILNDNGNIKIKKEIKNGPNYWTSPVGINKTLFIPTSQTIYKYNGSDIKQLDNFPDSKGPVYISYYSNKICFNDLNEKKVKIYDLNNNKIISESMELNQRSFMSPLITGNFIFIIDIGGMIYRFNLNSLNSMPEKLNINSGVMSNLIPYENNLYFTANDGYFYKININIFNSYEKIIKIDNDNNKDKYLTKKLLFFNDALFFCGENGTLFYFDCIGNNYKLIKINESTQLIGSPILINKSIYLLDTSGNFYEIKKID